MHIHTIDNFKKWTRDVGSHWRMGCIQKGKLKQGRWRFSLVHFLHNQVHHLGNFLSYANAWKG